MKASTLTLVTMLILPSAVMAFDTDKIPNISASLAETSMSMRLKVSKTKNKEPSSTNGNLIYDKNGNYKGVISKNQKCVFYNAYSTSSGIQISYSQINSVHLTCN